MESDAWPANAIQESMAAIPKKLLNQKRIL